MAQGTIDIDIINTIEKYIAEISKCYKIDAVIIFGSYAKGRESNDSDIDIAVVSEEFTDRFDDMAKLMKMTWDIDTRIEPHPIKSEDYYKREDCFINEIIETGIKIA